MLQINNISKRFNGIKAVDSCSFNVEKGKITALIGPNGAGKTTLFNVITGYSKPNAGTIHLNSKRINESKPEKIAQKGVARTFQIIRLFKNLTVLENILLAMPTKHKILHSFIINKEQEQINIKKAIQHLEFVGLHVKLNEKAKNLSYGQQKLLEIAKVFAQDTDMIMLDEPASGVNLTMLAKIKDLILKLKDQGKTILFIEHNMDFVMDLADKVVVLDYGKKIAEGNPQHIQNNKDVIDAYLGGEE